MWVWGLLGAKFQLEGKRSVMWQFSGTFLAFCGPSKKRKYVGSKIQFPVSKQQKIYLDNPKFDFVQGAPKKCNIAICT